MSITGALVFIGYVLLLYTAVAVAGRALRRRDPGAAAPLPFLFALLVAPFSSSALLEPIRPAVNALLPVTCLLVVAHLRTVARPISVVAWSVPIALAAAFFVAGQDRTPGASVAVLVYLAATMLALAGVLGASARAAVGVQRRRIGYAAAGAAAFGLVYVGALYGTALRLQGDLDARLSGLVFTQSVAGVGMICIFLAFAPPRRLVGRWRRGEHATYLAGAYEREPEERGWLAAEDLVAAVSRCLAPALVFVARPRDGDSDFLIIRAASHRPIVGRMFRASEGMVARAAHDNLAAITTTAACGEELTRLLGDHGHVVLVAPIVAGTQSWGIVMAVHHRAPLFPDDDLTLLVQLGRSAAIAFDHAQLIVERRARARHEADTRLRELESRVDLMLDSIRDYAMFVLDEDGIVAAWHAGAQEMFGYTRDETAAVSGARLFDVPPETLTEWLAEASTKGKVEREGSGRHRDGHTFMALTTIRPLVVASGTPPGFVVVTRDVTERRQLEQRLHHGQKMQAIGQLAGGIAHDFNNLLTAILGYSEWLEREMTSDPRVGQVAEIHRAAERAADLTRQLLAFSRRQVVQVVSLDVTRLVRDLLPMLRRLMGHQIEIVDATSSLSSAVLGDRSQLEQVVVNLVLNARDAMPSGGQVTIRTTDVRVDGDAGKAGPAAAHVLLEVSDTGAGMDEETRRRAFEPFFTTKVGGRGTGLGLATVYGIVQQMSGLIELESRPGRGTTIRVYLPHSDHPALEAEATVPATATTGRETLLLIEDDDALRTYLVHVLEAHGYHVIPAEGAEAALTVTEAELQALDLVISDVAMRGMTGPEVVAELASLRPGLPALYISGDALSSHGDSGRIPVLHKPFSSTDLLAKVREILSVS